MSGPETSDQGNMVSQREGEWVLVPRDVTPAMLNAAIDVDSYKLGDISPLGFRCSPQMLFERCWNAMIAAAPPPEPRADEGGVAQSQPIFGSVPLPTREAEEPAARRADIISAWTEFAPRERPGVSHWDAFQAGWTAAQSVGGETVLDPKNWEVEVRVCGVSILTIGHDHVAGRSDIDPFADTIRTCADHLRAFIGSGEPVPCFACGDTGQERWMGLRGEEIGPCSVCSTEAAPLGAEPRADDGVVERHMLSEPAEQSSLLTKGEVEDGFGSARASRDARSSTRPDSPHSDEGQG